MKTLMQTFLDAREEMTRHETALGPDDFAAVFLSEATGANGARDLQELARHLGRVAALLEPVT